MGSAPGKKRHVTVATRARLLKIIYIYPKEAQVAVGRAVREIREKQKRSQWWIDKKLGCKHGYGSRIERGRAPVSAGLLFALTDVLNVRVSTLMRRAQRHFFVDPNTPPKRRPRLLAAQVRAREARRLAAGG